MKKFWELIKASCSSGDQTSSKRIVMYIFVAVAILMVLSQIYYTFWMGVIKVEAPNLFPEICWYSVFSVIFGFGGINAAVDIFKKNPTIK